MFWSFLGSLDESDSASALLASFDRTRLISCHPMVENQASSRNADPALSETLGYPTLPTY